MAVQFFFLAKSISLTNRNKLKAFLPSIFKSEKRPFDSLTYIFCSDDYLLEINRTHLKHDFYTDIITFDLSEKGMPTVGEIYISLDRVRDNANIHQTSLTEELHRVMFHGALHLCGFKDKSPKELLKMRAAENACLKAYFG